MNTIYKVDFNSLKSKLDELENEYSNFSNVAYKNYLDSYLKTFGGSTLITSMKDSLDSLYSNVNNGYKKIIDWLDNYYTISNNIENVLAKYLQLGSISEDNIRNYIENKLLNIESNALTFANIPKLEKMGFNFFNNNDTYTNFSKSSSNKNYNKADIKNKITKDSMIEHKSKNPYWLNNHLMDEYSNEKSALENKFTNFIIKNERSIKIKSNNELGFKSYYTEQELTKYVLENPEYFKNLLSSEEFKNIVGMTYEEYVEAIDTYNCQIATCKASMYATKQEQKQAQYVELMQSEDFLKFKSTISTEEAKYYCLTNLKYLGIDTLASIGYLSDDETLLLVYLYQNEGKKSVKKFIGAYEDKINQAKGKAEADKYIAEITDDKAFSNFVTAMSNGVEIKSIDDVKAFINLEFNETDQEILKEINECLFNYYTDAGLSNEYLVVNNENSALAVVQTYTNLKNAYGIDIANTYVSNIEQCLNDCSLTLNISIKDGASKYFTTFGQGFGDGIESFTEGFENIFRTEGMISDNQYTQMYIASYLNGKTSLNLDYQISTSIGNMTPTVVLATLTGGTMQPVVTALNFASSFGNTYNQGLINGNNNMSSALNAVVVAGSDSVIEALAGGINALRLKPAAKAIEDTAEQALKKALKVKLKDSLVVFAKGFVPNAFKEGGQEAFQSYLEAYSNKLFFGDEVDLAETSKEALYSATVGAFTASIMNSANFVSSLAQTITVHGINKEIEIGARIKFDNEIINGNIDLSQYNNVEEAFKSYITNNPDVMNFGSLKYIFNKMGNDFVSKVKQKTETAKENALNFIADNGGFVDLDGFNKKSNIQKEKILQQKLDSYDRLIEKTKNPEYIAFIEKMNSGNKVHVYGDEVEFLNLRNEIKVLEHEMVTLYASMNSKVSDIATNVKINPKHFDFQNVGLKFKNVVLNIENKFSSIKSSVFSGLTNLKNNIGNIIKNNNQKLQNLKYTDLIKKVNNKDKITTVGELKQNIIDSIPSGLTDFEKARFLYLELSKRVGFDENLNSNPNENTGFKILADSKNINDNTLLNGKIICKSWSKIYNELLSSVGINSEIKSANHAWVEFEVNGMYFLADATKNTAYLNDLAKISQGEQTNMFYPINKFTTLEDAQLGKYPFPLANVDIKSFYDSLLEVDKGLNYIKENYNNVLDKVCSNIENNNVSSSNLSNLVENKLLKLNEIANISKLGYVEAKSYILSFAKSLSSAESDIISGTDLYRLKSNGNVELINITSIKQEDGTYKYFAYHENTGIIEINTHDLSELILSGFKTKSKNGIAGYKYNFFEAIGSKLNITNKTKEKMNIAQEKMDRYNDLQEVLKTNEYHDFVERMKNNKNTAYSIQDLEMLKIHKELKLLEHEFYSEASDTRNYYGEVDSLVNFIDSIFGKNVGIKQLKEYFNTDDINKITIDDVKQKVSDIPAEFIQEYLFDLNFIDKNNQTYNFFKNHEQGDYGADQAAIEKLSVYELNGRKYNYRNAIKVIKDAKRNGEAIPYFKRINTQEYLYLKNKIMNMGFTSNDSTIIMDTINAAGACSYASVCNNIYYLFRNREGYFKKIFGYDMYKSNGEFNSAELLLDLYIYANTEENGGHFIKKNINGKYELNKEYFSSETIDIYGRDTLDAHKQEYMSLGIKGRNNDTINNFLKSKNQNLSYESSFFIDNFDKVKYSIEEQKQIIAELSKRLNDSEIALDMNYFMDPNHPIVAYSCDPENYVDVSTNNWNEGAGHSVTITGIADSGFFISSWGREYYITFENLFDGGCFEIGTSSIHWN